MNRKENSKRRSFVKWLDVATVLVVISIVALLISIAVFFANLKPGLDVVMWSDVIKAILLLHVFGLLLPMVFVTVAITNPSRASLSKPEGSKRMLFRFIVPALLAASAIILIWVAYTVPTQKTNGPGLGLAFTIASYLQPFVWIGFGLALSNFRNACEGNGRFTIGMAATMFLASGASLLIAIFLSFLFEKPTLIGMMLPSVSGIILIVGLCTLVVGIRRAKMEHQGYIYS